MLTRIGLTILMIDVPMLDTYSPSVMRQPPISWNTKKQPMAALSSYEAEYMALAEATKEMLYLKQFVTSIVPQQALNIIYIGYPGAITLTSQTKAQHIDIRCHFVKEQTEVGYEYVCSIAVYRNTGLLSVPRNLAIPPEHRISY